MTGTIQAQKQRRGRPPLSAQAVMSPMMVTVGAEQREWLRDEADRTGTPMSALVRRLIDRARQAVGSEGG